MRVPFSVVMAAILAGIGFAITAPIAGLWVLLHDEPDLDETW